MEWRQQALYTEEQDTGRGTRMCKCVCAEGYFLGTRADDDRPVSVPVGNGCLELFDAECGAGGGGGGGGIWGISLEVRRYTPRTRDSE